MTVREYDAKEKERLCGILRQTPSVLSLAVIFFVALSAQASAKDTKTFLKCEITELLTKPNMLSMKAHLPSFKISYELGDNNKNFEYVY